MTKDTVAVSRFLKFQCLKLARSKLARLTLTACLVAFGRCEASVITETVPFTISAPLASNLPVPTVNVSTPQFDPALGTLQSAATTITGSIGIAFEFFNTGAGAPYDILVTDTLSLAGIPGLFVEDVTGAIPAGQAAFITPPVTFPFGPVDRSVPLQVASGVGTWNQLYSLPFPALTINAGPAVALPAIFITGSSVTTYTYSPAATPVPEPRGSYLLGACLAFCMLVRNGRTIAQK